MTKPIVVGRIGSSYGVKGWSKIVSYTDPRENILSYLPWQINVHGQWKVKNILDGREQGGNIVVQFENCFTPEEARLLTGAEIAIERAQLPPLPNNEYYWSDLIGLTVIDQDQKTLGIIADFLETGSNDVIIIKGDKDYLIPYLPDKTVIEIDLTNNIMRVKWTPEE